MTSPNDQTHQNLVKCGDALIATQSEYLSALTIEVAAFNDFSADPWTQTKRSYELAKNFTHSVAARYVDAHNAYLAAAKTRDQELDRVMIL